MNPEWVIADRDALLSCGQRNPRIRRVQMSPEWVIADREHQLLVNMTTGCYYGCSQSNVRNTKGRLFSSTLVFGKPADYHCVAWSEL
jgi:hypothetical protein